MPTRDESIIKKVQDHLNAYTVQEFARLAGCSESAVHKASEGGAVRHYMVEDRKFIPKDELTGKWLTELPSRREVTNANLGRQPDSPGYVMTVFQEEIRAALKDLNSEVSQLKGMLGDVKKHLLSHGVTTEAASHADGEKTQLADPNTWNRQ